MDKGCAPNIKRVTLLIASTRPNESRSCPHIPDEYTRRNSDTSSMAARKYSAPLAIPARTCAPSNCQFIGGLSFSATRLLHDRLGRPRSLRGHHFIDRKDCLTVLLALRHLADIDRRICLMVVLGKAH